MKNLVLFLVTGALGGVLLCSENVVVYVFAFTTTSGISLPPIITTSTDLGSTTYASSSGLQTYAKDNKTLSLDNSRSFTFDTIPTDFKLREGHEFTVEMDWGNAVPIISTVWAELPSVLNLISVKHVDNTCEGCTGGGGTNTFKFEAIEIGTSRLALLTSSPSYGNPIVEKIVEVTVTDTLEENLVSTCEGGNTPDEITGECPSPPIDPVTCEDGTMPDELGQKCVPIITFALCDDGSTPDELGQCPVPEPVTTSPSSHSPSEDGELPPLPPLIANKSLDDL